MKQCMYHPVDLNDERALPSIITPRVDCGIMGRKRKGGERMGNRVSIGFTDNEKEPKMTTEKLNRMYYFVFSALLS